MKKLISIVLTVFVASLAASSWAAETPVVNGTQLQSATPEPTAHGKTKHKDKAKKHKKETKRKHKKS
jgi:hypothetical protein